MQAMKFYLFLSMMRLIFVVLEELRSGGLITPCSDLFRTTNLGHDFQLVRDDTFSVLRELVENNENKDVSFHVSYDPDPKHRSLVKKIQDEGFALKLYSTNQIFEAGTVLNQQGNVYQVFTPFTML